jgi:DNA-binding NarL/FixJ family response regulator
VSGEIDARSSSAPVRVALVHPMRSWVDALEVLLAPREEVHVVAGHTDLAWGRHAVVHGPANVLLMYVGTSGQGLGAVLRDLFAEKSDLAVVALSDSRDPAVLASAVRAGVRGWVEPTVSLDQLVRVLVGVSAGETRLPPDLMSSVLDNLVEIGETRERTADVFSSLTARELDVLRCLTEGLSRQEIAQKYFLSPHTVRTHINHVLHKLNVHSTLSAVSLARRVGLSTDAPPQSGRDVPPGGISPV